MGESTTGSLEPLVSPSLDRIRHGDECPDCGGCVVWNESEDWNGCVLQCDECNTIFG